MVVSVGDGMIEGFFPATAMPDPDWWEALWPRPGEVLAELGLAVRYGGRRPLLRRRPVHRPTGAHGPPRRRGRPRSADVGFARARVAAAGAQNCEFIEGDAYDVADWVSRPVDFVLMANTFHGVPEKERLARAVATILRPGGRFAVVNWHRRPRVETTVLGQPRGPKHRDKDGAGGRGSGGRAGRSHVRRRRRAPALSLRRDL